VSLLIEKIHSRYNTRVEKTVPSPRFRRIVNCLGLAAICAVLIALAACRRVPGAPEAPGEVRLDKSAVVLAADQEPLLGLGARLLPYFKDSDPIGLRVMEIDPHGLLARLGIMRKDILRGINLLQLNSAVYISRIAEKLRDEPRGSLTILRAGREITIRYVTE
jgi:S1-C subfamily serine protease